jgi:EAL domain-containing protein (putative c-di-GMP-specific phosphodiesterase class I)
MLKLLNHMLGMRGYTNVTVCEGARLALGKVGDHGAPIDLILCDLNMPDIDGLEFVRGLVDRQYKGSVVLVSGADERVLQAAATLVRAHSISVLGYLRKPVSPQALTDLLGKWTRGSERPGRNQPLRDPQEVRFAIASGELVNYYQPKVDLVNGHVVGVETLVRWEHPRDGIIMPDQFICVAEEHGLIGDLTRAVTREALNQSRSWVDAGLNFEVAINVSMDNLTSRDFSDFLVRQTALERVDPRSVVVEVTESRLMQDLRATLEVLTRLRLKGFRLSIDDFGTGHSSLAQLRDLPFTELKVDRGFVRGARDNQIIRPILEGSVGIARRLGLQSVAEGVETEEDWHLLRELGCDLAQGYCIGRPMPSQELQDWLDSWRSRSVALLAS